jgi:hypothetical protein
MRPNRFIEVEPAGHGGCAVRGEGTDLVLVQANALHGDFATEQGIIAVQTHEINLSRYQSR